MQTILQSNYMKKNYIFEFHYFTSIFSRENILPEASCMVFPNFNSKSQLNLPNFQNKNQIYFPHQKEKTPFETNDIELIQKLPKDLKIFKILRQLEKAVIRSWHRHVNTKEAQQETNKNPRSYRHLPKG